MLHNKKIVVVMPAYRAERTLEACYRAIPLDPDAIQAEIQKDLRTQIAHNLAIGVLKQDAGGAVRYSWRGMLFIWLQFLRDLVRLS